MLDSGKETKTMVRVLHYIGSLEFGGSQAFVMEIYRKIDREKLQFDFVTFPNERGEFYDEIIRKGGKVYECPQYNGKNHRLFVKWWRAFFEEHPEYRILHGHIRSVASIYIPIAKKKGVITIVHSHSTSNGNGIIGKIKDLLQFLVRKEADYLFACSDAAGMWMFGKNVKKQKNYKMIPNAIDSERFAYNSEKRKQLRLKLGLDGKFVIGTVGRLTLPKNHSFLIDVFYEIHKERKNAILLLVGDGELKPQLQNQVRKYNLQDFVVFAGSKSNTQDYYQVMDVFAFPSLWEGLGIVAIEAQCSGLPCVVSERIPQEADMKVGLFSVTSLESKEAWKKNLLQDQKERKSQIDAIKKSGYDVVENAIKLQEFYIQKDINITENYTL